MPSAISIFLWWSPWLRRNTQGFELCAHSFSPSERRKIPSDGDQQLWALLPDLFLSPWVMGWEDWVTGDNWEPCAEMGWTTLQGIWWCFFTCSSQGLKINIGWVWWCTPLTPALRREGQGEIYEIEASLVHIVSSRTSRTMKIDHGSKTNQPQNNKNLAW